MNHPPTPSPDETALDRAIAHYYELEAAGQAPDLETFLRSRPELESGLREFFQNESEIRRICPRTGLTPARPLAGSLPRPGETIGEYELVAELARGGMGAVFRARQSSLDREVALKIIPVSSSESDARRVHVEAEITAALDHPHIVPVHAFGHEGGFFFMALRLVEGQNLSQARDRFLGDFRATARLLETLARTVHHAHERGILHRDLKPANVLIDGEGQPHLTDFGLARILESDQDLTRSGAIVGTPRYMAPEQVDGPREAQTSAVDVYSLGAILYELLGGHPPFGGDTSLVVLQRVLHDEPVPPRRLDASIPADLETICLKCLEKNPARRYPSARDLAEDLARYLRGEPITARPLALLPRWARWARRHPALATLVGVVTMSLVTVATLSWSHSRELGTFVDELRHHQYSDLMRRFESQREARQNEASRRTLEKMRPERGSPDLRGFEWHLQHAALQPLHVLDFDLDSTRPARNLVSVSGDSRHVGLRLRGDEIRIFDLDGMSPRRSIPIPSGTRDFRLGGDSSQVHYQTRDKIWSPHPSSPAPRELPAGDEILDLSTDPRVGLLLTGRAKREGACWIGGLDPRGQSFGFTVTPQARETVKMVGAYSTPDSPAPAILAFSDEGPHRARVFDLKGSALGTPFPPSPSGRNWNVFLAAPESGRLVVAGSGVRSESGHVGPVIEILSFEKRELEFSLLTPADHHVHLEMIVRGALARDERRLAVGTSHGDVLIWDLQSRRMIREIRAHEGAITDLELCRDDRLLITAGRDGKIRFWAFDSDAGRLPDRLPGKIIEELASGPTGTLRVIHGNGRIEAYRQDPGLPSRPVAHEAHPELEDRPDKQVLSDDGTWLASVSLNGEVRIVEITDLPSGSIRSVVRHVWEPPSPTRGRGLAFSPDGRRLLASYYDGACQVFDRRDGGSWHRNEFEHGDGSSHFITWTSDGRHAAGAAAFSNWISIFRLEGPPQEWGEIRRLKTASRPSSLAISPDSRHVAIGTDVGSLEIWDLATAQPFTSTRAHRGATIPALTFTPDATRLVSGGTDGLIKLWDLTVVQGDPTALEVGTLRGHEGEINTLRFDSEGAKLISGGGREEEGYGEVGVWGQMVDAPP